MSRAVRLELGVALAWFVFGAVVSVASWRMDRLVHLGVEPWSAPGLTPGVIGGLMMVFALALAWQAVVDGRASSAAGGIVDVDGAPPSAFGATRRTWLAAALCVLFAGVSLGRGVPFAVEGAVFVFVFTTLFSIEAWRAEGRVARGLLQTLAIAVVAAGSIAWLFERVFLVRLP